MKLSTLSADIAYSGKFITIEALIDGVNFYILYIAI